MNTLPNAMPVVVSIAIAEALHAPVANADLPPMTLDQAITFALAHHPSIRTAHDAEHTASARTDAARIDELPQAGLAGEFVRGTGNVLPGSIYPMTGIPSVTGPPMMPPHFDSGAWGSAVGMWASWDVTDLARRMALVDASLADERTARAATDADRLRVGYEVADAFVAAVDAREEVHAAEATRDRSQAFATQVHVLVDQQLRPGADAARADAELAFAQIAVSRAEQSRGVSDARLAEALGVPGQHVSVVAGNLVAPAPAPGAGTHAEHPLLVQADRAIDGAVARQRAIGLEYLPRVDLVASLWLRGSGYPEGSAANLGAAQGLVPDTPNWATGIVVSWPVMEMFATRARQRIAAAQVDQLRSHRAEIAQAIAGQMDAARAVLEGAISVSRNTAPALAAARMSEQQARTRYQNGLATAVDVADAERVLAQAEVQDVDARLGVRRAMLLVARAAGDLSPFMVEADTAPTVGH